MIRPYNLTNSKIHHLQSFVNHILLEIIFRAPSIASPNFTSILVLPKYRTLIDDVNNDYVLDPLTSAYQICKTLERSELKILRRAVHNNNKIRELCNGSIEPITYEAIEKIDPKLKKSLKKFCDSLYDHVIGLAPCYHMYEDVNKCYKRVVKRSSVCRCCGINKVLTEFHLHRSALDHYLPRKHYPFNSVNFKNLMPICDICNSKYKLGENPLLLTENKGQKNEKRSRQKAFYPFRRITPDIKIRIDFRNLTSIKSLEPDNIDIKLTCTGFEEEVRTWDRIFGIEENYKAECCTDEMLGYYEEQYIADILFGKTHKQYIEILDKNKYADANFLKIPFLDALNR